ncbi:MAG: hypothetical protein A4E66_02483 [Syntrophus sp. PtaB.Bin001]|nr:MAG: hypothetical protein A4E66_02483 [Syntrophus sp. PtaB.Bin001]
MAQLHCLRCSHFDRHIIIGRKAGKSMGGGKMTGKYSFLVRHPIGKYGSVAYGQIRKDDADR